jgi:hypothetical protein
MERATLSFRNSLTLLIEEFMRVKDTALNFYRKFSTSLLCVAAAALFLCLPAFGQVTPLGLRIENQTVPPGGTMQVQLFTTEPKPILKGGQRMTFAANFLGPVQGMGVYSPAGDVSGVAVTRNGATRVNLSSPLTSLGTVIDDPMLTITMPVLTGAVTGQTSNLTLDPKVSSWADPNSQKYPVELTSGVALVGGTLSVSSVTPSYGVVPAGTKIVVKGMGFVSPIRVDVGNAIVATTKLVSSSEVDVTLTADYDITGQRIRVRNKSTNERIAYFPYQQTTPIGVSTHKLIAASYPMFSRTLYKDSYFRPVLSGSVFSGLALQNGSTAATTATVQLFASDGSLLTTVSVPLAANSRIVRDLAELLPGVVASSGTSLHVTAPVGIQMLGLLGNDATSVVLPVTPSPVP